MRFALALLVTVAACSGDGPDIDPFPIAIDRSAGPTILAASLDDTATPVAAVIDTLSPVTVFRDATAGTDLDRVSADLTLYAVTATGEPTVPRARFSSVAVFGGNPCADADPCMLGDDTASRAVSAIIGNDVLGRTAVRIDYAASTLTFFPDIAGSSDVVGETCAAVIGAPYAGGGTIIVDGTEVDVSGRRPVLGACANFAEDNAVAARGTDLVLVMSTAVGPTLLAESAYRRYATQSGAPALATLPTGTVELTAGSVEVKLGTIDGLSLVGQESDERGPCTEVYANRLMRRDACADPTENIDECPCPEDDDFCRTAAVVDLTTSVRVAIVADDHRLLQGLRAELRPAYADIDGILGTEALTSLSVDLDYPNSRLILRCQEPAECLARPAIRGRETLDDIDQCPNPA